MTVPVDPSEIIRWMEVPRHPNVFALGNFARQVTFSSQQTRAFNLIWALFRTNRLSAGGRVAVVGAGLGGITATVAALVKGCHVDLYEQASQAYPIQRGNDIRFIHPNILRWPEEGSEEPRTDFPFLNWRAATVRGVIKQIDAQWDRYITNLRKLFNYRVTRLYVSPDMAGPQRPWLAANRVVDGATGEFTHGFMETSYDCVILAVGFGEERSMTGVPFLSYWENDSLHQETGRERRSILVSGCGDGGLIDALRLRLRNFDHAEFVGQFLGVGNADFVTRLRNVESELRRHALAPDISLRFQAEYDSIDAPAKVKQYFLDRKRSDTSVTLNSPAPGPFSFGASLLNRYATYLAMKYSDLHYLSGRIVAERTERGQYHVTLARDDIDLRETKTFDLLIVRHGPESALRHLLPEAILKEMRTWWERNEDITASPHWRVDGQDDPHQFFRGYLNESELQPEVVLPLALAMFEPAYHAFMSQKDVDSVAVGTHDGKAGFIVTLKPGVPQKPPEFHAGVLVQYVATTPAAPAQVSTMPAALPDKRVLPTGVGIYNYDAWQRRGRPTPQAAAESQRGESYPAGTGTLGCFAIDDKENIHLISLASVLAPDMFSEPGDRIFREGDSPATAEPIAILDRWVRPLRQADGVIRGFVDAASARLEKGVVPDQSVLPSRVGRVMAESIVWKAGRTSGITFGRVDNTGLDNVVVTGPTGEVIFDDCFLVIGEESREFCLSGDGGAVVVRRDNTAVGLLIAIAPRGWAVACSLERALASLNLELLPNAPMKGATPKKKKKARRKPSPRA